jgi:putative tricarboxylic transport membrane protein
MLNSPTAKGFGLQNKIQPVVLAFVLGPMMEMALRQSLIKSQGTFLIFFTRPISAACLLLAIAFLVVPLLPWLRRSRRPAALGKEETT